MASQLELTQLEQTQLESRARLKRTMVHMLCTHDQRGSFSMVGIIVFKGDDFLYVVVRSSLVFPGASYDITLPDGSKMRITSEAFSVPKAKSAFTGFYVSYYVLKYDASKTAEVEFGDEVSMFQSIHLCEFVNQNFNTTIGHVIQTGVHAFKLSCGPTLYTANGAAVFDEHGRLVGICCANELGPSTAFSSSTVQREMNKIVHKTDTENFRFFIYMDSPDSPF